jgi:type III restriction enzyme
VTQPILRIRFDANQQYQLDAIRSVTELFDGLDRAETGLRLAGDEIVANMPEDAASFDDGWLLSNLQAVQERGGIPPSQAVTKEFAFETEGVSDDSWSYPSFTVEMETGTGKTYVYLRTILELRRTYGFRKFVIVVPSVAIYEGVAKTFEITRSHFKSLFDNEPVHLIRYDGSRLSTLREFATSPFCEILLITLDSFNKSSNTIYRPSESLPGERKPYQFIQETRPILILDEPQNMETKLAKSALATLHPLLSLRYSATHRSSPNLIYRLTPFDAFQQNLVKRIQVVGVTEIEDANKSYIAVNRVPRDGHFRVEIRALVERDGRAVEQTLILKKGDNLFDKTHRAEHRAGFVIAEISRGGKYVLFENGLRVREGEDLGYNKPEVFRAQIRETIQRHMTAQEHLKENGIKVLSLFFIDRVANYTDKHGIISTLFDEEFKRLRGEYQHFAKLDPATVREAYFATSKQGRASELIAVDIALDEAKQKKDEREAARRAFSLIMRDKERLLSFDEPVSFIFAHSALKEGWDNPNVFQICTLNQTTSEMKKRQEIGRGLRLAVDQRGERVAGDEINVLTVIANQSYQSYAAQLQEEYVEEGLAADAPPKPTKADRKDAIRNDRLYIKNSDFKELWRRLMQRVRYDLVFNSDELVRRAVEHLNNAKFPNPKIVVQRGDYVMYNYRLHLLSVARGQATIELKMQNTRGDIWTTTRTYKAADDLAKANGDERLRRFKVLTVAESPPSVVFENDEILIAGEPREYSSAEGQVPREQARYKPGTRHPVFNVIDRAQRNTGLTRRTLNRIFRELSIATKRKVFSNPEGWASEFIAVIRGCVADLVAESLTFRIDGTQDLDLDELFPKTKKFVQKELIEAGDRGLYDFVQQDSGVERVFIQRLREDRKVELYFKFPPAFKVGLPKVIGNYNPDWGIIRRDEHGAATLHLVRETKGTEEIKRLRFPNEKRKVIAAKKYFEAAGVDYRVISEKTIGWWTHIDDVNRQLDLAEEK